jgi:natural product biosynthesis luciferase-like monooxygenase protein
MDELSKRFAALSPEQRQLLELRLKSKGLSPPTDTTRAVATVTPETGESSTEALTQTGTGEVDWKQRSVEQGLRFSLYFFSGDGSKETEDKYRLVIESAKFADRHGFDAVWTPERHFQDFGGLYPNPSVLSAALAVLTERLQIRAGSVALPLHHPVRVAEEWSVIDNLSRGRVAVSFASGWHPDDFIFAPDAYDERRETMFRHIELIQKLWAGEAIRLPGIREHEVEIKIMPRPLQPRLPVWITSSGSAETWSRAGAIGANVLAAYVGYSDEELKARIGLYRESRAAHGHDPHRGLVTLMLHTFVGQSDEAVRRKVRVPFTNYLRTYFKQYENVHVAPDAISDADKDALMAAAFDKYFESHTLLGTPAKCARLLDRLAKLGVDEVACLVDFGVEADAVLDSLHHLNELREHYALPHEHEARHGLTKER